MNNELSIAIKAAKAGAKELFAIRHNSDETLKIDTKPDGSKVTNGDLASSDAIHAVLKFELDDPFILDEEHPEDHGKERPDSFWIIDPNDGTKDYINGGDEYNVLVAKVENNRPTLGIVLFPETGIMYYASKNEGIWKQYPNEDPVQASSHSIPDEITGAISQKSVKFKEYKETLESVGIHKFVDEYCSGSHVRALVENTAQVNVSQFGKPKIWDIAPADIILEELGGRTSNLLGENIDYLGEVELTKGQMSSNNKELHKDLIERIDPMKLKFTE